MNRTIPLIYIIAFLFLFGESLQPAPRTEIYEDIVCRNHYAKTADRNVTHDCKIPPVQQELALLGGIERLSIIVPSLLAIPFAALADRYGHSFILGIALFGVFLEEFWPLVVCWWPNVFPIRLIWLHFVFSLVGGGMTVVITLLHVIVVAVVETEERTSVFFKMRAAGVGASVLGYAVAGASMKVNVWLPWGVGLLSLLLATAVTMTLPQTTSMELVKSDVDGGESWRDWVQTAVQFPKSVFELLTRNRKVMIMLILVFICQLGFDSVPLMMAIYVSKRFGWSFANASFLNSLEMSIELLTLLTILPLATILLSTWLPSYSKDMYIARASVAALAIGTFCIGFAPVISIAIIGIIITALGTGQDSVLRSMVTDMVDTEGISIAYSAITMLRAIGGSLSGPIYAGLYAAGLRSNGPWLGLPFLIAGVLFTIALVLLLFLRDDSGYEPIEDREQEQEHEETLA